MSKRYIESVFEKCLEKEPYLFNIPSENDWNNISAKFGCIFNQAFKDYTELISKYILPGSLNVASMNTNGDDTIKDVYEYEMKYGNWNSIFIPFFQIGNGDYFCLNALECPNSFIYFYNHEDESFKKYMESFESWIENFESFYIGK